MDAHRVGGVVVAMAFIWMGARAAATETAQPVPGDSPPLPALGTPGHATPPGLVARTTPRGFAPPGIVGSPHDLSLLTGATDRVCVFCHTPHASDVAGVAPLWNRATTRTPFVMYSSDTLDMAQETAPGAASLACLSCHDGTLAYDQLVNAPGPGGLDPAAAPRGWAFVSKTPREGARIGPDLRGDHPVAIHYDASRDPGFHPKSAVLAAGLRLFGPSGDQVECASCHDPHGAGAPSFLRRSNAGSALCLTCHRK